MKSYKILTLKEYRYAVIATSYLNPLDDIDKIEHELQEWNFCGQVLFDLLLCNGLNINRYIQMEFNGNSFINNSLLLLRDISECSRKEIFAYLEQNHSLLEGSILPNAQRHLIRNGKII